MSSILKKTAVVLCSAILFYVIGYYEGLAAGSAFLRVSYSYPVLVFVSVIYGPIVGAAAGLLGQIILQTGMPVTDWAAVICTPVYCALVGFFTRKIDIHNGFFDRKDASQYNKVQILAALFSFQILYPAFTVLIRRISLASALALGVWLAIDLILGGMLIATLALALYAKTRLSAANFYRS